ncbi:Timeless protein [Kalmanozyma brasiliensis GHG001]|uniref:Timeless N-terminal domain-containing protein n=1 Tax=Kalmanozyma brasiliensis (strain GHG001) TaxID=1365824 RepID=V5EQM1_KALBG|nr:Timeless protein [Kalmanozyma brasiliensis GHG001]EST05238.1 Timeless protein [Kalmanozyma brasiliensis GHG001]
MADENDYYSDDLQGDEGFITDLSDQDGYGSERGGREQEFNEADAPDKEEIRDAARDLCMQIGQYDYGEDGEVKDDDKIYTRWKRGPRALGALRSLRKLWKLDDEDPTRKVARAFADNEVLENFIVPALLESAGQGKEGDAIALACTDLLTAMTWPFDAVAELREQEKQGFESDDLGEITRLDQRLINYKAVILRSESLDKMHDVLGVIMRYLLLPNLATKQHQRSSLVTGIIGMCLHFFRNLLAIRDPVTTSLSSVAQLSTANLQSKLILAMQKHYILDTLLMLASSAETLNFNAWNAITSECIFHIFVGTKVKEIADLTGSTCKDGSAAGSSSRSTASASKQSNLLADSLATEAKMKRASALGKVPTRHSRFGTTINFIGPDGERRVARNQSALVKPVAQLAEEAMHKGRRRAQRRKDAQERGAPKLKVSWDPEAALVLQDFADTFVQSAFESLAKSILKDIRSERDKLGDLDIARIRIMQLGAFFLEYFLSRRASAAARRKESHTATTPRNASTQDTLALLEPEQQQEQPHGTEQQAEEAKDDWPFELVSQWLEPWAFRMVLVRTIQAQESKGWLEFVASVQLWIVLLRLVDELASSKKEAERDVAEGLQAEFYYMSETLDACHAIVRSYTSQSFAFLDTVVNFAYVMPKMLERYASNRDHMYVQAKKHVRRSRQEGDLDADEDEARQIKEQVQETRSEREFRFADFQRKLATKQLAKACIDYLARWQDYTDMEEQLNKLVTVMHRIAIKANDYRQFFLSGHRAALRKVISGDAIRILEARAPTSAPNLKKLMDYILRKFSKLSPEEQSIYDTGKRPPRQPKPPKVPAEIAVRPGMSREEEIGVAVGLLLKKEKMQAVLWVKSALEMASALRTELLVRHEEEAAQRSLEDPSSILDQDGQEGEMLLGEFEKQNESPVEHFQAFELAYRGNDELRMDASLLPELKLLCRLVGLEANEDELVNWRWSVPKEILPTHLDDKIDAIERFIREPLDTHGRELTALVMRVRKARVGADGDADVLNPADLPSGWNGEQSDSDGDGDYFDRVRANRSLVESGSAAADGGLLRSSGGKKFKSATKKGGSRKQKRRMQQDFINDSDDEFAFAMGDLQETQGQQENAADSSDEEGGHQDHDDDMERAETPSTSPVANMEEGDEEEDGKLNALQALRAAKKQRNKASAKAATQPLQDASERTNRRVDTKRLFLADSDDDEDDVLALPSQESVADAAASAKFGSMSGNTTGLVKKRRLAILDDEDEDEE